MTTTLESLQRVFPQASPGWLEECLRQMPAHGVDLPNEMATFLAQCGYESNYFRQFEENLNYQLARLLEVFPKYFKTVKDALPYAQNPEGLANHVYADANRTNKLGNTEPGDGWLYRGRGILQITGRSNYDRCGKMIGADLLEKPELLLLPKWGVLAALAFWKLNKMDAIDDDEDQKLDTRKINGGEHGLAQREELAKLIRKKVFS